MMHRLMNRRASLLGSPEWLEAAQKCFNTDAEQQFCSFGLRLSSLIEGCDIILKCHSPPLKEIDQLLKETEDLVQSMVGWHQGCNCFQHRHFIGPQVAFHTRSMQQFAFQNIEIKKRLSRCISIRAPCNYSATSSWQHYGYEPTWPRRMHIPMMRIA